MKFIRPVFFLLVSFILLCCKQKNEKEYDPAIPRQDTFVPARVVVLANLPDSLQPKTTSLAASPKPAIIFVPTHSGGAYTVTNSNGVTSKIGLEPPVSKLLPVLLNTKGETIRDNAGNFFIMGTGGGLSNFTTFTTDNGLALDGLTCSLVDKAGNLWLANATHATDVVNAALEIRDFMQTHKEQKLREGKEVFEIRIGIHTGPVVAGIVGIKKFAYDIWGDTVNTASRMESSGEAGKVNISATTYELVKDQFTCTYCGKVEAKKKGFIDMYFVERII